ncbi:MAG TPA: hypothetical protein VGG28_05390 [Kofleriaceae bacterium]|jgi:hypothetical protein
MRYVAAVCAIALIATAMFAGAWFRVRLDDPVVSFIAGFQVDLRQLSVCGPNGVCQTMSLAELHGGYPIAAVIAFWSGGSVLVIVSMQVFARLRGLALVGYGVVLISTLAVVAAAFVVAPTPNDFADGTGHVTRTLAPFAMVAGNIAALLALRIRSVTRTRPTRFVSDPDRLPVTPITPHRMVAVEPPPKRPLSDT